LHISYTPNGTTQSEISSNQSRLADELGSLQSKVQDPSALMQLADSEKKKATG
jgi:hypothetical protein